ncbi:hypothetical protein [Kitasatospora mediocidica]|uniref:hypothetical protein n=1 Tax=Kitasatospora mediocidica TaxID=58352 RepID=UPI00068D923A|nr:hypothetical protein [Kitasatospora mediocidica]
MSGATTVRRGLRLALVSLGVAAAVAGSGAVAFADGPSVAPSASASAPSAAPSAAAGVVGSAPSVAAGGASAAPAPARSGGPQVVTVPKGGAQTGEGTTGRSDSTWVAGGALAAVGVAGIGFAVVRRRAGAQG